MSAQNFNRWCWNPWKTGRYFRWQKDTSSKAEETRLLSRERLVLDPEISHCWIVKTSCDSIRWWLKHSKFCYRFHQQLDRVNELVIDGNLLNSVHSLQLKFKWSKVYIDLQRIVKLPGNARNIKNLLNAAENDSSLSITVAYTGVTILHQFMNELSDDFCHAMNRVV